MKWPAKNTGRRRFLQMVVGFSAVLATGEITGETATAADLKVVHFSEAVHNLGYINLYVGMHSGIFAKNGLDMKVTAAGGDTQTFAAVLGGSADFAIGDATMAQISRENGGPAWWSERWCSARITSASRKISSRLPIPNSSRD
jgi:NitT/TauT family transport system substrate-binding protein